MPQMVEKSRNRFAAGIVTLFASFERRMLGALVLITLATIGVQIVSVYMARSHASEVEALASATVRSEQADNLVAATQDFRLAAYRMESAAPHERARRYDELTDAAVKVSALAGRLRNSGLDIHPGGNTGASFDEIDKLVDLYHNRDRASAERQAGDVGLAALAAASRVAALHASEMREGQHQAMNTRIRDRFLVVTAAGAITLFVVIAMLADLVLYILPDLRAMHSTLQRLSQGDLDVTVPTSKLKEVRELSGALEIVRRNAQAVRNLAYEDPSTGLPNRRAFVECAARAVAHCQVAGTRDSAVCHFAVMQADIDRFKHINDDFGHATGDQLVNVIAKRMVAHFGDGTLVARVGGDEFAIFLPIPEGVTAIRLGSDLVAAMRKPIHLEQTSVVVTLSIGIAEYTLQAATERTPEEEVAHLLNCADMALYASKHSGRNRATQFTPELAEQRAVGRALERDLAKAVAERQFRVVYQPILDADASVDYREVEALVRWDHPTLGSIPPARFIAVAERSGLMHQLGVWIIEQALTDLAQWPDVRLSLNLSPQQLQQQAFAGWLLDACKRHAIMPSRIYLEVTESISIETDSRALLALELLRCSGFRIALDDFGTGYSSLNLLKSCSFDRLKLDRSLIVDLDTDPAARAVFEAAVTMALRVNAEVVAEGVSDPAISAQIVGSGCTHVQGFAFSPPLEASAVEGFFCHRMEPLRRTA